MSNQRISDLIAKQDWLEPVENGLQATVKKAFEAGGDTGRTVENVLHGEWLGNPLHAALTDVPLGAWTAAVAMDALETASGNPMLGKGADAAIGIGLLGAVAAAVTGLTDWQYVNGEARRVGLVHGLLNLTSTALFASSFIMRRRDSRGPAKIIASAAYSLSLLSAHLGGDLVYHYGVGVQREASREANVQEREVA